MPAAGPPAAGRAATYAAGPRRPYADLPAQVRQWVESRLGGPATQVRDLSGGFSPGVAAVVRDAGGRALFVKAVGAAVNPRSLGLYQAERERVASIPPTPGVLAPSDWADLDVDGEAYAVLLFPALDGAPPAHPWRATDLERVLRALEVVQDRLTPSPWPPSARDRTLPDFFGGWSAAVADPTDPWHERLAGGGRLGRYADAEAQLRAELPGTTLSHIDLRADNVVLTADRVWFVDWAHAQNGAWWADAALLFGDVVASRADRGDGGALDLAGLTRTDPLLSRIGAVRLWRTTLGLAGALHAQARRPSPPGLPTIRGWQQATAETLLAWCERQPR